MKKIINDLYKIPRYLIGEGFNEALEYINNIIPLEIHSFKSETKVYDWEVPYEWVVRDAWVKFNGKKILDFKENPLCITQGSIPVHEKMDLEKFKEHLSYSKERPEDYVYDYELYGERWGFTMPYNQIEMVVEGEEGEEPTKSSLLQEGEYEVFIDSEYIKSELKIGVHTIPGTSEKEILLFAHLDHPYQANDNLSAVAGLIDMAKRIEEANFKHTVKLVFAPETIGSITYANKLDISNVDFVIALECIGNDNTILFQKTYKGTERINNCCMLALQGQGASYRAGQFRLMIGSDEYIFNDPLIGIPGIMLSRWEYPEYHTSADTPEIINEEKIKEVQDVILKTIEIYEADLIPKRKVKAPLMRKKYDVQTPYKLMNRNLDYIWYDMDGKKYLSEIIAPMGVSFDFAMDFIKKIKKALW